MSDAPRTPPTTPTHPPQGQTPPPLPPDDGKGGRGGPLDGYNTLAETVGCMPTLRAGDNAIQALVVAAATVIGAAAGWLFNPFPGTPPYLGAVVFGVGGLIAATFLSGIVLMVLGWVRAGTRKGRQGAPPMERGEGKDEDWFGGG